MYYKPYDLAMLTGRFQHIHVGHESLIETGLKLADRMLILVGSAQEQGTKRNPYDVSTRIEMIKEIYPHDNVIVKPLVDLTHEEDVTPDWGRFVLKNVKNYIYKTPEVMVYGNDESRSRWFDPEDIKDCMEIIVPRARLPISATQVRQMLLNDDFDEWMKWVNPKLHKHYPMLRQRLVVLEV